MFQQFKKKPKLLKFILLFLEKNTNYKIKNPGENHNTLSANM